MILKKIENPYFMSFIDVIESCIGCNTESVISDIVNASYDNINNVFVYPDTSPINLQTIKLDDITKYRKEILKTEAIYDQLPAVDAVCINSKDEWFFIEFKNSKIDDNKTLKSIRKKMINSLWFVFFLYSKAGKDVSSIFSGDITKYARERITYVIVGSSSKNELYSQIIQADESSGKHYTPQRLEQFKGYYFKNVYMLTENELRNFILDFDNSLNN